MGSLIRNLKIKCVDLLDQHSDWGPKGIEQVWDFAHIQPGDRIVANRGTKEVVGIGTVTGSYTFVPNVIHGHHLPVQWEDTRIRPILKKHWVRTIIELSQNEFEEIMNLSVDNSDPLFDKKSFDLLMRIHEDATADFYKKHKKEFKEKVEEPLKALMHRVTFLLT